MKAIVRQYKGSDGVVILFPEEPCGDARHCASYVLFEGHSAAKYHEVMDETIPVVNAQDVLDKYNEGMDTNYKAVKRRSNAMVMNFYKEFERLNKL